MITLKEDTTLVGISELRTHIHQILEVSKRHKVLIGKRNKPVAVLISLEKYQLIEETLETLEDYSLAILARERESRSKASDYISIDEAIKKIKPR